MSDRLLNDLLLASCEEDLNYNKLKQDIGSGIDILIDQAHAGRLVQTVQQILISSPQYQPQQYLSLIHI